MTVEWQEFKGRKIMVFGASSGIGRACAVRLGEQGAKVILTARSQERLEETASHIPEGMSVILPCDVSDFDAAQNVVKEAVKLDGARLDGCVFSAGIFMPQTAISASERILAQTFRTNFYAFAAVLRTFASRRVSNDGASVVGISSQAAITPFKGQGIYSAAKAAMNSYAAVAAQELAVRRIRINTVCPDMVDTPMGTGIHLLSPERLKERYPLGILTPEDIAGTVLFLLGDASKKITGQTISITAGSSGGSGDRVLF